MDFTIFDGDACQHIIFIAVLLGVRPNVILEKKLCIQKLTKY